MTEDEYSTKLFEESGFERKQCTKCKKFFWTLGESNTCGDPPCTTYSFIGNPAIKKKHTLLSMREAFLSFFEKKGHTRIKRYPVVARWRDDILYTGASIYCFQPWVLNRTTDPPENPLTMSQPSIRFGDIDNVGRSGRHCSIFEMMAHHAFNTDENTIYWKDELLEYAHEFATSLGIPKDEIIYKEYPWAGGGNAGPAYEMMVRGLEIATLVLMQYEKNNNGTVIIEGEKYAQMPMRVVDTGYGLERWVWMSQGTPTLYDCIHKTVIDRLIVESGVKKVDERIQSEYSTFAGLYDISTIKDAVEIRKKVADALKIDIDEVSSNVVPYEHIYTVADHTKTVMFALCDSVVPSNVKEGYLMRLLIRKAIRSLQYLNVSLPISEIVQLHINDLSEQFPELRENQQEIVELVEVEERKFQETLKRGKSIVQRHVEKNNLKSIPLDDLKMFWHTHGLLPENVKEFSDITVDIPNDFSTKVAHETPEDTKPDQKTIDGIEQLPPTKTLYQEDIYEFRAKVLYNKNNIVVLDQSAFYPTSGGQIHDIGHIENVKVTNVEKIGHIITHEIDAALTSKEVFCRVDKERRSILTKHHTATHIVNAAARKVLGNHVWQTGAYKELSKARLDITHYEGLNDAQIKEIEDIANEIVSSKIPIEKCTLNRNEAEAKFGFRIYQGGAVPGRDIRIVKIADLDVEACGGTHCNNTSEVGKINIIKTERIQDGVVRIEYSSDKIAWGYLKEREKTLKEVAEVFKTDEEHIVSVAHRFFLEWKEQKKEIEKLKKQLAEVKSRVILQNAKKVNDIEIIVEKIDDLDNDALRTLAQKSTEEKTIIALTNENEFFVLSCGKNTAISAKDLIKYLSSKLKIRGGGSESLTQGTINGYKKEEVCEKISAFVTKNKSGDGGI